MPDIDPIMSRATIEWPRHQTDRVLDLIRNSDLGISVGLISSSHENRPKFSFVQNPDTEAYTSVITKADLIYFAGDEEPEDSSTAIPERLFDAVVGRFADTTEAEDYLLFDDSKEPEPQGIRLYSALDLLRRLKQDESTEAAAPAVRLQAAGQPEVDLFESYCQRVFPYADIELATQELDRSRLSKMLARSNNRRQAWQWIGAKPVGHVFRSEEAKVETGNSNLSGQFKHLQEQGLVDNKPVGPGSYSGRQPLTHSHWPFVKLFNHRWADLNRLVDEAA